MFDTQQKKLIFTLLILEEIKPTPSVPYYKKKKITFIKKTKT